MYRNKFLDNKLLPTCLAPWHALTVKWGGNVVPDIIYKDKLGNINKQTLKQILEGEDAIALREAHRNRTIPDVCSNCAKKEKSGRSRRMFFWDKMDYDVACDVANILTVDGQRLTYIILDFTVSVINATLACIHCNPFVSTGWTKDGKKLNKEAPEYWEQTQIGLQWCRHYSLWIIYLLILNTFVI